MEEIKSINPNSYTIYIINKKDINNFYKLIQSISLKLRDTLA
jgi:hypothetical protein